MLSELTIFTTSCLASLALRGSLGQIDQKLIHNPHSEFEDQNRLRKKTVLINQFSRTLKTQFS